MIGNGRGNGEEIPMKHGAFSSSLCKRLPEGNPQIHVWETIYIYIDVHYPSIVIINDYQSL